MDTDKKVPSVPKTVRAEKDQTPSLTELLRADDELRTVWRLIRQYDLREKALQRLDLAMSKLGKRPITIH